MKAVSIQAVVDVVAEVNGCEPAALADSTDLFTDLGMDSLAALELLVALEDRFDVDIDTDDAQRIRTIGDIVELLAELLSAPKRS